MSGPRLHRVLIIGSGPAGLTAAVYAARANLKPLCVEGFNAGGLIPGGQLMFTSDVENYPGFPSSVSGQDLMLRFRQQAEHQGTEIITADVPLIEPALTTASKSSGTSKCSAVNIGVDEPPGVQNFSSRPSRIPPARSSNSRKVVPIGASYCPGLVTRPDSE